MINTSLSIQRIKNLRIDNDYSQKQIASYLEVSRGTYSQIEAQLREIRSNELEKLAILYDITSQYLLGFIDTKYPYPTQIKSQVKKRLGISDEKTAHIFNK